MRALVLVAFVVLGCGTVTADPKDAGGAAAQGGAQAGQSGQAGEGGRSSSQSGGAGGELVGTGGAGGGAGGQVGTGGAAGAHLALAPDGGLITCVRQTEMFQGDCFRSVFVSSDTRECYSECINDQAKNQASNGDCFDPNAFAYCVQSCADCPP